MTLSSGTLPLCASGKVNVQFKSFVKLYADEIEDYLQVNPFRLMSLRKYFDESVADIYEGLGKLHIGAVELAFTNDEVLIELDRLIYIDNRSLWRSLHLCDISPSSRSFSTFSSRLFIPSPPFLLLDRVAACIDVPLLLPHLCRNGLMNLYSKLMDAILQAYGGLRQLCTVTDPNQYEKQRIARRFLRELPRLPDEESDWFFDLVEACSLDEKNRTLTLQWLCPSWRSELNARHKTPSRLSFTALENVLINGMSCRPPEHFAIYRKKFANLGGSVMPSLREYQKELVERANRKENTIICAPTGAGKTVVGASIVLTHLNEKKRMRQPARVVMVVPKVFLVEQQAKLFSDYVRDDYYVEMMSGDANISNEAQLLCFLSADIVVLTPQILVNMLHSEEEAHRLFVSDISLLLLDECHHTGKNNPYNVIMQRVKEAEYEKPQIIGMTASLGVGDGKMTTLTQAFNHAVRLCLRLSSVSISTVVKNKHELLRYVNLPDDCILPANKSHSTFEDSLTRPIQLLLNDLYKEFNRLQVEKASDLDYTKLVRFPEMDKRESFTQAVVLANKELSKLSDGERKWILKRKLDFVDIFYKAIQLNDLLPAAYAYSQLTSDVENMRKMHNSYGAKCEALELFDREKGNIERAMRGDGDKEILRLLRQELHSQLDTRPDSRILIFCLRRETTQLLSRYINDQKIIPHGRRAEVLTSTNASSSDNGQSSSRQRAVIDGFMRGDVQVIVSTTVAEEGLDVAACNLIIKYNMTGNVISLVQQRGRAREKNGRSVLIALHDQVRKKELLNKAAAEIMEETLKRIHEMGDVAFKRELREEEIRQALQQKANEKEEEKRRHKLFTNLRLLCEKCDVFLCKSSQIRQFRNHFVCVNEELWGKVNILDKRGGTDLTSAEVRCRCGAEIGEIVKIEGVFLPALRASAMLFITTKNKRLNKVKKWKAVMNTICEIDYSLPAEISRMSRALHQVNPSCM